MECFGENSQVHPDCAEWELPKTLGGDETGDETVMIAARREVLQPAAGLETHFSQRLLKEPYALCWVCFSDQPPVEVNWRVAAFYGRRAKALKESRSLLTEFDRTAR